MAYSHSSYLPPKSEKHTMFFPAPTPTGEQVLLALAGGICYAIVEHG